ncbi:MAG: PspA/IM30 family protein [Actinomycetaceae bacterium]|nr:PspA/IM30 family protein [Actinomycetaceae bacterium]
MAEKQTLLGRITQLAMANINALLDRAEDPQKMLDQLVRDYSNSIAEAETSIAQTIGNLRMAEKDYEQDKTAVAEWGEKAASASTRADALREKGDTAGADKFDNLAKVALSKQIEFEKQVRAAEPMLQNQREVVERLKSGLEEMKTKLSELQTKRDQLVARQKTVESQQRVQAAAQNINVLDPTSDLARWEDKIRRQEAEVAGRAELAKDSFDSQFAELEDLGKMSEVEARLAALKNKQ